jgi:FtsH-binding integral membrane protein
MLFLVYSGLNGVVGVIVFTGLTAWDAQRLKQMAAELPGGRAVRAPSWARSPST